MKELQRTQRQLDAQQANDIQKKVLAGDFKEIDLDLLKQQACY